MQLTKEFWTKREYKEFVKYLYEKEDEKFKEFSKKIILDNSIIGIRTPVLKNIAKEIHKGNYRSYLKIANPVTYEEKLIYGLVICNIKKYDKSLLNHIDNYVKYIDNWALCDLFCSNLKIVKKNKSQILEYILEKIKNENIWERRFCFVLLLDYYIEEQYLNNIFNLCDTYNTNDYYVKMSVAWLISMCYIKYKEKTIKYLNNNTLDIFTYNKALQKIIESKRIGYDEKQNLKQLKRGDSNENRNL